MSEKLVVDVLTLDAVQCAACQYMFEAISALPEDIRQYVEFKEWTIKNAEGIGKFMELNGKVLPTIAIKGELIFESIIPTFDELLDALEAKAESPELKAAIAKARAEAE